MKKFWLCIPSGLFPVLFSISITACVPPPPDLSVETAKVIEKIDKEMCAMAEKEGFNKALIQYADDSLIKPKEGELPVMSKKEFLEKVGDKPGPVTLTWWPVRAEAAISGELGYTFGHWKFTQPDTTYYGNYLTIWKKHADGSWKWVYDGGTNTPERKD